MKNLWYTKELKPYAQELRKNKNMTRQERMLWYHLLRSLLRKYPPLMGRGDRLRWVRCTYAACSIPLRIHTHNSRNCPVRHVFTT